MKNLKKLRVGIIVDDLDQSYLVYDLYQKSLESDYYSVVSLIIQKPEKKKNFFIDKLINYVKTKGIARLIDRLLFEFINQVETQIIKKKKKFKFFFYNYPLSKFNLQKTYVCPEISTSGLYYKYKSIDINKLKKLNLDVLIRGGSGILKGEILNLCKFGIISFHHGDNDFYRGGPPGFWEVYNKEPSTGFVIQRLTEDLDGGKVIFKGNIPTSFFYKLNVCNIYLKSSIFLHKTLEKLSINIINNNHYPNKPYNFLIYKIPKFYQSILYIFKTLFLITKKIFSIFFNWSLRWNVAYQFIDDWKNPDLSKSIVIKNPKNRFLADPFVLNYKGKTVAFVEDYNFTDKKGKISAYEIYPNGYKEIGVAIEEKFHLSYPHLIKSNNDLFMLPESHESKDIRIYRCVQFPLKWKLHRILMKNVNAVDTNIFKFDNRYWLFTNLDSSKLNEHSSELHVFYSDKLDSSTWTPHPLNPVIFDSRQARNGGMIYSEMDQLYRVFQRQDFNIYGASIGISKINILTENKYEEKVIKNILPTFKKNIKGIHSFTYNSGVLINDFVKNEKID